MKNIRTYIIKILISISKSFLSVIYFFLKCFPIREKVVLLSRQSNKQSIDFTLIEKEILERNKKVELKILCKKLENGLIEKIKYCFYILKCIYHIATAKVCVVDGYSIPISILNHKKELEIIQIWHASGSIKKFGLQSIGKSEGRGKEIAESMNMHRNYTHVMSPSGATAKFYEEAFGTDKSKIFINALPRLDYLLDEEVDQKKKEEFYREYPQYEDKKTILYVPTFRIDKDVTEHIQELVNSVNNLKYNLIIKLHPLDQSENIKEYTVNKKYTTYDLLKISDYIITDYSAVAFETSILNKPLYFYVYDIQDYKEKRGLNVDLFEEMNSATSTNIKEIIKAIENDEYDFEELAEFRAKYMGTDYYNNTKKLVDFIFKYLDKEVKDEENIDESSKEKLNI